MSTQTIEATIRRELEIRRGTWKEIASQSGVSYSWISKFMNGHIPNPGTRTLNRLAAGISTHPKEPTNA